MNHTTTNLLTLDQPDTTVALSLLVNVFECANQEGF